MTPQQHCDEKFRELAEEWLSTYGGLSETSLTYAINDFAEMVRVAYNTNNHSAASPAPSPLAMENLTVGAVMAYEAGLKDGAAQAREKVLTEIVEHLQSKRGEVMRMATDAYPVGVLDGTVLYLESLRTGGDGR